MDTDRLQRELHEQAIVDGSDATAVSEMQSVWTTGRHIKPEHTLDISVRAIHIGHVGSATWHGPGQLVCYPAMKLKEPVDLYTWVRAAEAGVIAIIREEWQPLVHWIEGHAGVWLTEEKWTDRKICAIGSKVARGATLHGIAPDVDIDPASALSGIIPYGLSDADATSLSWEGVHTDMYSAAHLLLPYPFTHIRPLLTEPDRELRDWIVR